MPIIQLKKVNREIHHLKNLDLEEKKEIFDWLRVELSLNNIENGVKNDN